MSSHELERVKIYKQQMSYGFVPFFTCYILGNMRKSIWIFREMSHVYWFERGWTEGTLSLWFYWVCHIHRMIVSVASGAASWNGCANQ